MCPETVAANNGSNCYHFFNVNPKIIKSVIKGKAWRIIAGIIVLVAVALWVGGIYLSQKYETLLRKKIAENLPESISADFSSLKINLFNRAIALKDLEIIYGHPEGKCDTSSFSSQEIILRGISLTDLLFNECILINHAKIINSSAVLHRDCIRETNSLAEHLFSSDQKSAFAFIQIANLHLQDFHIHYFQDSASLETNVNSITKNLKLPLRNDPFNIDDTESINLTLSEFIMIPSDRKYTITLKSLSINSDEMTIQADSLSIKPRLGKFEFGQKTGRQTDRFDVSIPRIVVNNIPVKNLADSSFMAEKISVHSADLKVFRDKRLPFIKHHNTPIPAVMVQRLPFLVDIDSVTIHDASVQYEEFPADMEGTQSGVIRFSALNASAYNVSNHFTDNGPKYIDLDVQARFMNSGMLAVSFDIPYDTTKAHRVEGNLRDFELTDLNPMLKHLAMIQVNSGRMTYMPFSFSYDDNTSTGEVELNYEKLKVISLQEKKDGLLGINELKTFLINIFLRKNKNENLPKEKRTGAISFQRDKKRSVFNYMWNSLFSGIKASYNLENVLPDKKESRKSKKEKKAEGKRRRNKLRDVAPV